VDSPAFHRFAITCANCKEHAVAIRPSVDDGRGAGSSIVTKPRPAIVLELVCLRCGANEGVRCEKREAPRTMRGGH
jgi:hypothetical protein